MLVTYSLSLISTRFSVALLRIFLLPCTFSYCFLSRFCLFTAYAQFNPYIIIFLTLLRIWTEVYSFLQHTYTHTHTTLADRIIASSNHHIFGARAPHTAKHSGRRCGRESHLEPFDLELRSWGVWIWILILGEENMAG